MLLLICCSVFDFRAAYVVNTEGIFDEASGSNDDISGQFMRLKNVMTTELHTKWNIAFFLRNTSRIKWSLIA